MFSKRSNFGQFKFGRIKFICRRSRPVHIQATKNKETGLRHSGDEDNLKIIGMSKAMPTVTDPEVEKKGDGEMDSENSSENENQNNTNTDDWEEEEGTGNDDTSSEFDAETDDGDNESDSETDDDDDDDESDSRTNDDDDESDSDDGDDSCSSESETEEEEDLMFSACKEGDTYYVRRRVSEHQAIVHIRDPKGRTPLFYACAGQQEAIVKFLLQNGAKTTTKAWCSMTPLHMAFRTLQRTKQMRECSGVVRLLVRAGADFNVRDRHGMTPLDLAFENNIVRRDLGNFSIGVNDYFCL